MSDTMSLDMDPNDLHSSGYEPGAPSPATTESGQPNKKKRKAWGQPIPEFKEVIGPRKRAKTAEEKEQRKNERILRNRRAADKSRQRQKLAVAELETREAKMKEENVALRNALLHYQRQFGPLPEVDSKIPTFGFQSFSLDAAPESKYTPSTASYLSTPRTPALSYDSPMTLPKQESPAIAPTLFPSHDDAQFDVFQSDDFTSLANSTEMGMTQYPAAILCDLQCQPLSAKFQAQASSPPAFTLSLALLHLTTLSTISTTFSLSTLSPLAEIFRTLVATLSTPSMDSIFLSNPFNFSLLHGLISTPSTPTNPKGMFRTKLLSRLLACSPRMARLLLAATERALLRVVEDEVAFAEDPQARWMWASLLTLKWTILRLEKEHRRYRLVVTSNGSADNKMDGVDYQAVERSSWRWKGTASGDAIDNSNRGLDMGAHTAMDGACAVH